MRARTRQGLLIAVLVAFSASAATAASYIYSSSRQTIRVCNLLLPGAGSAGYTADTWNSGLFKVMDDRLDLKPPGWTFVNPLASPRVTAEINARYGGNLTVGQIITKDLPPYWDVKLDETTLSRILQFDLVYLAIPAGQTAMMSADERELLRKLVDSGAQLWIDWGGGSAPAFSSGAGGSGFFVPDTNFRSETRRQAFVFSRHHSLMSYPFWLSQNEVNMLGANTSGGVASSTASGSADGPFPPVFSPVVQNGGPSALPQIAAGQYGSGHIILTANNIGGNIVRRTFGSRPDIASPADLKFAYNVVAWGSNYTTTYKDPAHTSSSGQGPGAPLVQRWQYPTAPAPGTAPVIYKGIVFYTDTSGRIHALDAVPQQDLDNDGNPDDGVTDLSEGAPYDELYVIGGGGVVSGPTIVAWPGGGPFAAGEDVILVQDASGTVSATRAFPPGLANPGNFTAIMPTAPFSNPPVPSPTYHNGSIYAMGGNGYLYITDLLSGNQWNIPGNMSTPYGIIGRNSSPTVGWVQDEGTKAMDLMAYWLTGTAVANIPPSDRLFSGVFAVRNEPLTRLGNNVAATRYNNARVVDDGAVNVWARPSLGPIVDLVPSLTPTTTPGQFVFTPPGSITAATPIFADYQLTEDMAKATVNSNLAPRTIATVKPDPQANSPVPPLDTTQTPTPAMGPDGTLYLTGTRNGISQLAAVREYGPRFNLLRDQPSVPQHKLDWTFWFGSIVDTMDPAGLQVFPAIDYTTDVADTGTGVPLGNFRLAGPPAVTDDAVYVTGQGQAGDGTSATVLFAFARKWQFQVQLPQGVSYRDAQGNLLPVRIWQPNPFGSGLTIRTPREEAAIVRDYALDRVRNTITIDNFDDPNFLIGAEKRPLMAGFPVHVWIGDVEIPVDSSRFSNLRWYFVAYRPDLLPVGSDVYTPAMRDSGQPSPPAVFGDHVFFGTGNGMLYAVRAGASATRGKQVFGVKPNYTTQVEWDNATREVKWQAKVANNPIVNPIASAGGLLAILSQGGLALYDSPATIIVDNKRIVEVDGGSAATWSMDGSTTQRLHGSDPTTPTQMSVRKTPFSRPSVVRTVDNNDLVVADTGNNRIIRTDRAGNTITEIRTFYDPRNLLSAGEPLLFNGPTDVRAWMAVEQDPLLGIDAIIYHYLVADRENFRVLDLIVRFDANTGRPLPASTDPADVVPPGEQPPAIVNWASNTRNQGRMLRYQAAQIFPAPGGTYHVWAAVTNYAVQDPAASNIRPEDAAGGAIVRLDYGTFTPGTTGAGSWSLLPGNVGWATNQIMVGGTPQRLVNPRFFEKFWESGSQVHAMICDRGGVWEVQQASPDAPLVVVWSLPGGVYQNNLPGKTVDGAAIANTGVPLLASSAKVLPNGRVLIANSFTGLGASGREFHGEVFEVDRKSASGTLLNAPTEIFWRAPALVTYEPVPGETAIRQELTGSYVLEQPTFVDRR